MKRTMILCCCLLLCFAACTKPAPAPQPTEAPVLQATEAPAAQSTETPADAPQQGGLTLATTTFSGETITNDVFREYDLILLNVWAEWCGPCVGEMPALEQLHQDHPNMLIIGAWIGESVEEAKETIRDLGVTYPCVDARFDAALYEYVSRYPFIPVTFFFDSRGAEIADPVEGAIKETEWKTVVEDLLP